MRRCRRGPSTGVALRGCRSAGARSTRCSGRRFHSRAKTPCYDLTFMDFRPTEEQELLRRTVREFAETEIRPHVREWDEGQHFSADLMPKLAALGLLGIQYPEQYGGAGLSAIDYCICIEELARVDPAIALSVAAHNGLCAAHIALAGTEQQKQLYLVPLARGEKIGAWGLTESSSGSDAAAMRTTAAKS